MVEEVIVKVLIVDDHKLFLDGFEYLFKSYNPNLEIHTAASTPDALALLNTTPDIELILLDLTMPGLDGISCLKAIKELNREIRVVIISAIDEPEKIREAMSSGVNGFIPKSFSVEEMHQAMDCIFQGKEFIPESFRPYLQRQEVSYFIDSSNSQMKALKLRDKQLHVLHFIADGFTVEQIGEEMDISPNTVKSHIKLIYQALNVNSRVAAVLEGKRLGLLE